MRIPEDKLPLTVEEFRRHYIRNEATEGWLQVTMSAVIRWQHPDADDVFEQMKEVAKREDRELYYQDIERYRANSRFPV